MLIKVNDAEVCVPKIAGDRTTGVRLVSIDGTERRVVIGTEKSALIAEAGGALLLRIADGLARVDAAADFATTDFSTYDGDLSGVAWTSYVADYFVDSENLRYKTFEIEIDALAADDPGYSGPSGFALIPGTLDIVVTMVRDRALRIVNAATNSVRRVELPRAGSSNPMVVEGSIFLSNYDSMCRVDAASFKLIASNRLQPDVFFPEHNMSGRAFIGVPYKSDIMDGWWVPRPYSSDILFVDAETLRPTGAIRCGGRPYALVEFGDGVLFIIDHPFDAFQTANVADLSLF